MSDLIKGERAAGNATDKETIVLQLIEQNLGKHHNALKEITVEKMGMMAKKTFDKKIKSLIADKRILATTDGNKKFYVLPGEQVYALNFSESNARKLRAVIRTELNAFEKSYAQLPAANRIDKAIWLCEFVLRQLRSILILPIAFSYHSEHHNRLEKDYRAFLKRILDFVRNAGDSVVYKVLINKLLDTDSTLNLNFNAAKI